MGVVGAAQSSSPPLLSWAKVRPLSLKVQATATLWRAATVTIRNWRMLFSRLQKKARTALPIVTWACNCWSPPFWQRKPFVQELSEAAAGFVENDWLRAPVACAKSALKEAQEGNPRVQVQRVFGRSLGASLYQDRFSDTIKR
eukprot:348371-Pyramimonas_sp.AAC.1